MQDETFSAWKRAVDEELRRRVGMPSSCLPDVDYWGLYTTGDTPQMAAQYALDEAART